MPQWDVNAQGSGGWLKSRIGVLTASKMADAIATTAKGESEKRRKLKVEILAERMSDMAADHHVNSAMQWGIDHEDEANARYEEITGNFIQSCGLALHDTIEFLGASPDGIVGDGIVEFKCPTTSTHLSYIIDGKVPEQYKPQMLTQLAVVKPVGMWCDFMSYDPRLPRPNDVFLIRYTPTAEEIAEIEAKAIQFLAELDDLWEKLMTSGDEKPPSRLFE